MFIRSASDNRLLDHDDYITRKHDTKEKVNRQQRDFNCLMISTALGNGLKSLFADRVSIRSISSDTYLYVDNACSLQFVGMEEIIKDLE
jgi:hypothetical protein